ncbi:hypothetical protein EDD63_12421 [Breznakia blatticola]|uniref:Uncharacterized protein n=1 Tax=Breznakia blatticola TaxID=1754012 RepID=A0A4V6Q8B3_9FIRM|nr:hypothetical protein [Breznakia blatticola]TDW16394.1 hypothetical protein EDD63_12421 [Breznakia blatticola]
MSQYSAIEKILIALESDLLDSTLNDIEKDKLVNYNINEFIERDHISKISMPDDLRNKITNQLNQGIKLSLRLEELSQRGIKVFFSKSQKLSKEITSKFIRKNNLYFIIGNEKLLTISNPNITVSYSDFKQCTSSVIFITDRPINTLLSYADVRSAIANDRILLISDKYQAKSGIIENELKSMKMNKSRVKTVFISGSRTQNEIPEIIQESLKSIIKQNIRIVIGDSKKGVDNEIIDYLRSSPKYTNVKIYTIKQTPRVKIEPEWELETIEVDELLKRQQQQMQKDRQMAEVADWGLSIFKPIIINRYGAIEVSSGTLRNTIQLLLNNKYVKFFYVINGEMMVKNLKNINDLINTLEQYKNEKLTVSEKEEISEAKTVCKDIEPRLVKYRKISEKFSQLLKNEQKIINESKKNTKSIDQLSFFG